MFYTIFYTTVLYVIHQLLALALKRGKTRKTVYLIDQLNVMKKFYQLTDQPNLLNPVRNS